MQTALKKILSLCLIFLLLFLLCSCGNGKETEETTYTSDVTTTENATVTYESTQINTSKQTTVSDTEVANIENADTTVILNDSNTAVNGPGASYSDGVLTISQPGTYSISGKLSDGFIYVNSQSSEKKVELILSGVDIYSSDNCPIFVESSPKETQIILAENTTNNLSDNSGRVLTESEKESDDYGKAVIFSKDDLQIEGTGTLNITADFEKGIFSKDDLQIKGGIINITSADDGIRGKDSLEISDSTLNITAKADGLRSSNETEENKGDISITNSTINITSDLDGIQSVGNLSLSGSTIAVTTVGGASDDMTSAVEDMRGGMGGGRHNPFEEEQSTKDESTVSTKGIKAAKDINVSGCTVSVNSVDDALHANKNLTAEGSTITAKTNDDGLHSELVLNIKNSVITTTLSYEGLESQEINIENSTIDITATDDGLNAAAADDQSENPAFDGGTVQNATPEKPGIFGGRGGMGGKGGTGEYDSNCQIKITTSTLCVKAEGDGIDSNGDIEISGSTIAVYGPTNGGNGSLDYGGSCKVTSGTLVAAGSSGMAQSVSSGSIPAICFTCGMSANTILSVKDDSGEEIISFVSPKQYSCVVFASDKLQSGKTYSVYSGGTNSGESVFGIYSGSKTENAELLGSLTAS